MEEIRVIIKEPGKLPREEYINPELENLQKIVGGYIETVTLFKDMTIICNEEGRLLGLPYNCKVLNVNFCGTIIFVGVAGEEFGDIPVSFEEFKRVFKSSLTTAGGKVNG